MTPINPKWERQFMISMLTLKTLEMELQEEYNAAKPPQQARQSPAPQVPPQEQNVQKDESVKYNY